MIANKCDRVRLTKINQRISIAHSLPPLNKQRCYCLRRSHGVARLTVIEVNNEGAHIIQILLEG